MIGKVKEQKIGNSWFLAERIFNNMIDCCVDKKYKEREITSLYNSLSQIPADSPLRAAFMILCEKIEEMKA